MLRRTFLKTIGAAVATFCLPISLIEKVVAKKTVTKKLPTALCPCCGTDNITIKDGTMLCHESDCGAEGHIMVSMSVSKWPETIYGQKNNDSTRTN